MTTNWIKPDEPDKAAPKFELAITNDEIYSTPNSQGKPPEAPPPPPMTEAPPVAAPEVAEPPPPVPAGPPGLLLARRRKSATEKLIAHPIIWPAVGAVVSLLVGFLAAFWLSGSLLTSNVKQLATERAILMKTPTEQRDAKRIDGLDAKIAAARSSVAWKCGGLWTLVFAAGMFTWSRVFRE
ncbi:hypothetical protein KKD52_01350 [Myxococcota bacterium]|nr:hypothetical protein [Myxococcota bacterium]MBU1413381.1 hypothetical protein [Myxococcota bacterium]MBU1508977.1 hypothetical protein [Myxococcota bacterium]